jgi:ATP-dependent DNA ligase
MAPPLRPPFSPMEALSVDQIRVGKHWQYEPKWDGFRCIVFRFVRLCVPDYGGR